MCQTLEAFLRAHARDDRRSFLEAVTDPHLLVATGLRSGGSSVSTVKVRGAERREEHVAPPMLLPIRRRDGADRVPGMVTLGRAPNSDVVLAHPRLSRNQAFFSRRRGVWHLGDPCSTNGTSLDGEPVPTDRMVPLRSGARIVFAAALQAVFLEPADLHALVLDLDRAPPRRAS